MKYYYPTSTLNFDAIYASMSIMPPAYYREEAIWLPLYKKTDVDLSDDVIVLYSRPIAWTINDSESDNYPMLVEIDAAAMNSRLHDEACVEWLDISSEICCIATNRPIVLSTKDMLSGNIKIHFRNKAERDARLSRAKVGMTECKCAGMFNSLRIDITSIEFPKDVVPFDSVKGRLVDATSNLKLKFEKKDFEAYERFDREKGAEVGFMAGKWIRSMRDGYCLDCVRGGFDYTSWKATLPNEFSSAIDMLCNKVGFHWDVNRDAIVQFCTELWNTCFKNDQTETRCSWHEMLRSVAKSHMDATFGYPVACIQDCFMQALACFIKGGRRHSVIVNSIVNDNVEMPELTLALHGALVGYSVLSRVVFEKRSFEISLPPPPPPPPEKIKVIPDWAVQIRDTARNIISRLKISDCKKDALDYLLFQTLLECGNGREVLQLLPKKYQKEGWGRKTKVYRELKKYIERAEGGLFGQPLAENDALLSATKEVERRDDLLINDCNLVRAMECFLHTQTKLQKDACTHILNDVQFLQKGYAPGGRYSGDETRNPRDNANVIRHLVNLINKKVPLPETTEESLYSFLKHRYPMSCNDEC